MIFIFLLDFLLRALDSMGEEDDRTPSPSRRIDATRLQPIPLLWSSINYLKKQLNRQHNWQWKFNFVDKMNKFLLY